MKALSNFLRKPDGLEPAGAAEHRPARPEEVHEALALILGSGNTPAPTEQVLDFIQFASQRGIDLCNLWVIVGAGGRLAWAIVPIVSPGRTMLLFTPGFRPPDLDLGPSIEAVCDRCAAAGVHLAQVLLDTPDAAGRDLYIGHGFREMAQLIYLQAGVGRNPLPPELPEGFTWQTYSPLTHALFERVIPESYQQSLDCPALNGLRDIQDVIAGHRASGEFDARFWFVLIEQETPRGVLLLNRVPRTETAELVYLGLVPAARGRGIGELMMRQALWAVRQMNLSRLTLAVDSRNAPALRLYYRHGMQRIGSKIALMRDLRVGPQAP